MYYVYWTTLSFNRNPFKSVSAFWRKSCAYIFPILLSFTMSHDIQLLESIYLWESVWPATELTRINSSNSQLTYFCHNFSTHHIPDAHATSASCKPSKGNLGTKMSWHVLCHLSIARSISRNFQWITKQYYFVQNIFSGRHMRHIFIYVEASHQWVSL